MSGTLQSLKQANLPTDLTLNLIAPHLQSAKKHIRLAQKRRPVLQSMGRGKRYALGSIDCP